MAKKKNSKNAKPDSVQTAVPPHQVFQKPGNAPAEKKQVSLTTQFLLAAGIGIITWLFLKECCDNQFTNWDDDGYITNNPLIRDLSSNGIKNIFSISSQVMGNYHPLTILSYAIEYPIAGLEPFLYHADSLLLHVADTMLVYWLVSLLTRLPVAAVVTALLFGLHPMHVVKILWHGLPGVKMFYMHCFT